MSTATAKGFGKLAFGVRYTGGCGMFFDCWTQLCLHGIRPGDEVLPASVDLPHHFAAELLVRNFLRGTADSLLFIDDDIGFSVADVSRLRDNTDNHVYDIIGAPYCIRRPPYFPCMFRWAGETGPEANPVPLPESRGTIPVGMLGLGFTLVRRSAFETLIAARAPGQALLFHWPSNCMGEDGEFFSQARATKLRVGADTGIGLAHQCDAMIVLGTKGVQAALQTTVNLDFRDLIKERQEELAERTQNERK